MLTFAFYSKLHVLPQIIFFSGFKPQNSVVIELILGYLHAMLFCRRGLTLIKYRHYIGKSVY